MNTPAFLPLRALAVWAGLLMAAAQVFAVDLPTQEDARLQPVFPSDRIWNGVTTTLNGRVFVCYPGADRPGVEIEEVQPDGKRQAYPDESWNHWQPGQDAAHAFVRANSLRIGPDGALWIVDAGAPGIGKPAVPGAGRLIRIDLTTNQVARVYDLRKAVRLKSYVDDVRFHGETAYLTDAGEAGLIVLDLKTGDARRVLDGDPSTTDERSMYADGKLLLDDKGKELRVQADQLEVSPDGEHLYYQPCSGPMSRIETQLLDDPALPPAELARRVEKWWDTPTCGGTAIDAQGNLYFSDTNQRRIEKLTPEKQLSTVIADPRLIWSDAMWIDGEGFLWIPATQQNLTPGFTGGKQEVNYPVWIYKLQIGVKPAPNDHL